MKLIYILFFAIVMFSCNTPKPDEKADSESKPVTQSNDQNTGNLDWLLGKWERTNEEEGKTTLEFWKKDNPSNYKGVGFTLQNGDTIKKEDMYLTKSENSWDLTVKVLNEEAITFSGINVYDKTFTVENNTIEFPNTIKYWIKEDTLRAKVSNADFEILFDFVKMKE